MESITFECEVITPMFLAGADGVTPELRAPSIKGALRFWWRAMNGHLPVNDIKDNSGRVTQKGLRTIEGEIFGDTSQKCKVIIICEQKEFEIVNQYKMIAHKGGQSKSFELGEIVKITLKLVRNVTVNDTVNFDFTKLKALFEVVCYLGGLGKRSRRGNGCLKIKSFIENENSETVYTQLTFNQSLVDRLNSVTLDVNDSKVFTSLSSNTNLIGSRFSNTNQLIPNIVSIEKVVKSGNNEQKRFLVSKATHNTKNEDNNRVITKAENEGMRLSKDDRGNKIIPNDYKRFLQYGKFVGAGQPRFASPIIVSISPNEEVIVTKLTTVKERDGRTEIVNTNMLGIQTNLIDEIKIIS